MNEMSMPKLTVITVVYNGAEVIEDTIRSVVSQDYPDLEYIVIDGASRDNTVEIVNKYSKNIKILVSEKDRGIYDAMNKGLALAEGTWVNFMNAGDQFVDNSTLKKVGKILGEAPLTDILYGSTIVTFENYQILVAPGQIEKLWKGTQFCHQSTFIRAELNQKIPYNITNKIAADFEFFYSAFLFGAKFKKITDTVSTYRSGGISDLHPVKVAISFFKTCLKKSSHNKFKIIAFYSLHISSIYIKTICKFFLPLTVLRNIRLSRNSKKTQTVTKNQ